MLKLRPFKPSDASVIAGWIHTETELRKWSSDRYGSYPITGDDIIDKYLNHNGDCVEPDNFYPMTAFDDSGAVGHFILRYTDAEKSVLRLGFVIVDDTKRGKGYGKEMRHLAATPVFKGIPNFRQTRIQMLRAETTDELIGILEDCRQQLSNLE